MTTYGLLALLLVGQSASSNFVLDRHPNMHGMDMTGYEHYLGHRIVSGAFRIGGEGELYIVLDRQVSKAFPYARGDSIVIYVGDEAGAALKKLGLSHAVDAIDMDHICGLSGRATVELSGVWTGIVEDHREYSSDLVRVIAQTPAHLEGCSGVVP